MSYTYEDFVKDYTRDHLHLLTLKEVLSQLSPKEVLSQFSPAELEAYLRELKQGQTH